VGFLAEERVAGKGRSQALSDEGLDGSVGRAHEVVGPLGFDLQSAAVGEVVQR